MDHQILALRYATAELSAAHLGLEADFHDAPGRLDYFVWLVRSPGGVILVDTGFERSEGARRGRTLLVDPVDALHSIGVEAEDVTDIVITHLHYDHAGNLERFPNARFHLQDGEMAYATGRCMCNERMRRPFSVADVQTAVRLVYEDRIVFHLGDYELAPGISVHLIGGHSRGLQVVRVTGAGRTRVVASDALHLGKYLQNHDVFPMFADYDKVQEGYRRLRELAGIDGLVLPGHDPEVVHMFPALREELPDIVIIE